VSSPLIVLERAVALSQALDAAGLRHAIGGALALGYHVSEPRGTRDIDVNVSVDPDDARRLFDSLPTQIQWSRADVDRAVRDGQVRLFWPVHDDLPLPGDDRIGRFNGLAREVAQPSGDVPVAAVLFGRRKPRLGD